MTEPALASPERDRPRPDKASAYFGKEYMQKGFVYILLSDKDKRGYTGSTNNVSKRFIQHSEGLVFSTKNRRPLRLIHVEEYPTLAEARKREKYLKGRQGRRELRTIFEKLNKC